MNLKKALFLDRDGIINIDYGYVSKIEEFEFIEGIFDLVKLFSDAGYLLFVVTNQSGIGRGYYTENDFILLTAWMKEKFMENSISIQAVYHCPHTPDNACLCRKPNTGMIQEALKTYSIDLPHSWLIGDKQSDIDLASNAGIGTSVAIGKNKIHGSTYHFESILACKEFLEENQGKILL